MDTSRLLGDTSVPPRLDWVLHPAGNPLTTVKAEHFVGVSFSVTSVRVY